MSLTAAQIREAATDFWRAVLEDYREEPQRYAAAGCRWVTIGGREEGGKKHVGGTPVCIGRDGRIVKGHPSLTGKRVDALSEPAEHGSHRQQLGQAKGYTRAVWAKRARAEGIDPRHLHQLAVEMLAHDRAAVEERTAMLRRARQLSESLGYGHLGTLKARAAGGKLDASGVRGLDDVAARLAEEYPSFGGDPDALFDLLQQGNPEPMSEEDAYGQALEHLREHRPEPADEEPVPFTRSGHLDPFAAGVRMRRVESQDESAARLAEEQLRHWQRIFALCRRTGPLRGSFAAAAALLEATAGQDPRSRLAALRHLIMPAPRGATTHEYT